MSEQPFKTFVNLITFDQNLLNLEKKIAQLHRDIAEVQAATYRSNQQLDACKKKVHDMKKLVDESELEARMIDEREKNKKRQLETLSNYKEYQSLKNEIDALKIKQVDLEQVVIDAWSSLENAQKEYDLEKKAHDRIVSEGQAVKEDKLKTINELENNLQKLIKQRPEKEQQVPAEWLEKYAMMRSRVEDPVVPVQNGSCSACYYQVSDQDMLSLRKRKLLQCQGCYRLIYSPEIEKDIE